MFRSLSKHASTVIGRIGDPFFEIIHRASVSHLVDRAVEIAVLAGSPTTEAEHLLLAIAKHGDSRQQRTLASAGIDYETVKHALDHELQQSLQAIGMSKMAFEIPRATNRQNTRPEFGPSFKRAVERASEFASEADDSAIGPYHLLLGILAAQVGTVPRTLVLAGVDREKLIGRLQQILRTGKPVGYDIRLGLINAFEPELELESDAELLRRMDLLRELARDGESLDALLPECFAIVRETAKRHLEMRHFDVQLIGGMVLHEGQIAEMKTGEGKTLTTTLPAVLNCLAASGHGSDAERAEGNGVHVVTANDYLAKRDAQWMEPIYQALGVSVGVLHPMQSNEERQQVNACDVVYGTPSEFWLDYLRDGVSDELSEQDQRSHTFAIVDEADAILIDEASSPLAYCGTLESRATATLPSQKYFRLYERLAGMTGTALHDAVEFRELYGLAVVAIPTNRPVIRVDHNDSVFKTKEGKLTAVVNEIAVRHETDQPVLVGTISLEEAELLDEQLTKRGITNTILTDTNPEQVAREAEIVAQAGRPGTVTIVTNMAGRGVSIKLGGDPEGLARQQLGGEGVHPTDSEVYASRMSEVLKEMQSKVQEGRDRVMAVGGLFVCATGRHESRRLDDQLCGRCGCQGDPGESRFYLSAEDELVRMFAGDRIYKILDKLGGVDDEGNEESIEANMLSKQIEKAQKTLEEQNFLQRKTMLEGEDTMSPKRPSGSASDRQHL